MGDHPRRCGENLDVARHFENGAGSPPQVRGKPAVYHQKRPVFGITPAGAGKTHHENEWRRHYKDHPRRCGENYIINFQFFGNIGSPPQVRGKQRKYDGISRILRITPAGAGKTKSFSRDVSAGQDHPRRCGENHFALTIFCTISGSPPQVRGKHNIRKHARYRIRITPAGAGKTSVRHENRP